MQNSLYSLFPIPSSLTFAKSLLKPTPNPSQEGNLPRKGDNFTQELEKFKAKNERYSMLVNSQKVQEMFKKNTYVITNKKIK